MKPLRYAWPALRWCAYGAGTLALWTLWLGLSVLLAVQVYVASTADLEVPAFVLRDLERRLAMSGVGASFGRTRFDPSGRVLIEDARLTLPGFDEPVISAKAIYARIAPWALLANRFDPIELRATGVDLRVPAMFAPSGRADEGIRDLDADVRPRGDELEIESLSFRLGGLDAAARGTLDLGSLPAGRARGMPLAEFLARNYGALSRGFAGAAERLGALEEPVLRADLDASPAHGAIVRATLTARGLRLGEAGGLDVAGLRVSGAFPLLAPAAGDGLELAAEADEARLPRAAVGARDLRVLAFGRWSPGGVAWTRAAFAAGEAGAASLEIRAPVGAVAPASPAGFRASVAALFLGAPAAARVDADLRARTASVRFRGEAPPGLVGLAGARLKRDLGRYVALEAPLRVEDGSAELGPGWRLRSAGAWVSGGPILVHGVVVDEVRGRVDFDGRTVRASDAYVRVGGNAARGSYRGDIATRRYRFLVRGRLRPLEVAPWFSAWWPAFFGLFRFPAAAPTADVDLRGQWGTDRRTAVFLSVDSRGAVVRGATFDRLQGRLFVRPQFEDVLGFSAASAGGTAAGTFSREAERGTGRLRWMEFDLRSTLDCRLGAEVLGPAAAAILSPFAFDRPPDLSLSGRIDGPAAPGGEREDVRIRAVSAGGFRFHDFPFDSVDFAAAVRGDEIDVDPLSAGFAGGRLSGRATVSGRGAGRTLSFEANLRGASLARAVAIVQAYPNRGSGGPAARPSAFLRDKADALFDLSAAAAGPYGEPLRLRGTGQAVVHGTDLLQVKLLGLLSQLLDFTSLRFTTARARFTLDGPEIEFPSVEVTGANSAIAAHGTYGIARHALDFNARIYPFKESKFLLPKIMNLATAPLSQVLEVRLTGALERPHWEFAAGPTRLLRTLIAPGPEEGRGEDGAAPPAK